MNDRRTLNTTEVNTRQADRPIVEHVVYARKGTPLLVAFAHRLPVGVGLVASTERELFRRPEATHKDGFSSSYLLGIEERGKFPQSKRLLKSLAETIVAGNESNYHYSFDFSFLKLARGKPPAADEGVYYEGFHLDSHPRMKEGHELLRLLFNFSTHTREFQYCETDWRELVTRGVHVGRSEYSRLRVPDSVPKRTVLLPSRTETTIHGLRFWASVLPHVGVNRECGYFLASFEAIAKFESSGICCKGERADFSKDRRKGFPM